MPIRAGVALVGLPLAAALALGAIVAPPDAAAASAVLREFNFPRRMMSVLQGESLLNDAVALLAFGLAVSAATSLGSAWELLVPRLLIAAQPTRGVDIAGIAFIHVQIARFRDEGGAVLLVSEELEEILALSDRIVGLYGGKIVGQLLRSEASVEKVGRLMLGQKAA